MERNTEKIGIVGSGLVGAGWAAFYASKGFAVSLYDVDVSARQAGQRGDSQATGNRWAIPQLKQPTARRSASQIAGMSTS